MLVGEANSGKSSLLNALVGRADLSPVDADVTTGVHIVVRYAPVTTARVYLEDEPRGRSIELADVAQWATVIGNPGNQRGVRAVEIGLDHPLLARGLILVDTPGVGGLAATHNEVTLAALRRADALIFVTDASAELAEPQVAFLIKASERVDTVIVALTKTDSYRGWATVMERNRSILAKRAAAISEVSIIPVSSHYHLRAALLDDSGNQAAAGTIRGLGGVSRLEAEISARVLDRLAVLRLLNLVRVCGLVLERLKLVDQAQEGEADPHLLRSMEAERARMAELRHADAAWPRELADGFQLLSLSMNTDLNRRLAELKRRYEAVAADAPLAALKADLPRDLDTALRALWTEVAVAFADGVTGLLSTTAERLRLERAGLPAAELDLPEHMVGVAAARGSPGLQVAPTDVVGELRTIVFGALPGAGLAAYAAQLMTGTLIGLALVPVGLVAGLFLGVAAVTSSRRRRAELMDRQAAVTLVRDTVEDLRTEGPAALQRELTGVRSVTERAIRDLLAARGDELSAALKGHEALLREDVASRRQRRDEAAARLAELQPLDATARRLTATLRKRGREQVGGAPA